MTTGLQISVRRGSSARVKVSLDVFERLAVLTFVMHVKCNFLWRVRETIAATETQKCDPFL